MLSLAQRSPKERMWIVGGLLAALLVVLLGWLVAISPQRSSTDEVNAQAESVRMSNVAAQQRISSLRAQSKDMGTVRSALVAAQAALPGTSGVPDFLRSLQRLGAATGAQVVSLTVGEPTDVSGGSATTAPGTQATAAPATGAPATGAPATGAPATAAPKGVYGLSISTQVDGTNDQLDAFLNRLQNVQPRAVLITHITQGSATGGNSMQLTMQAFVAPSSAAERAQLAQAMPK